MLAKPKISRAGRAAALAALISITAVTVATVQGCGKKEAAPAPIVQEGSITDHNGKTSMFRMESPAAVDGEWEYVTDTTTTAEDRLRGWKNAAAATDCWPETPLKTADVMPAFNGDIAEYLSAHINYPEAARKAGKQGRVVIRFVVSEDGQVLSPEVVKSAAPALDAEALRVVKAMPHWKPGVNKGKPASVYFHLPVSFQLS